MRASLRVLGTRCAPRAMLDDIPACAITLNSEGDPDVDYS